MNDSLGYYQILEVSEDANSDTIKQSYHNLAKKWHPDYNKEENAVEIFKKISVAYEVLKDDKRRLIYDILSLVYSSDKYPEYETMQAFECNHDGVNIVVLKLKKISAWVTNYKEDIVAEVADKKTAIKIATQTLVKNIILGWWHPKAFIKNIAAIAHNINNPFSAQNTLRIHLHNMITYTKDGQKEKASLCACLAKNRIPQNYKNKVDKFISENGLTEKQIPHLSSIPLKLSQALVIFGIFLIFATMGLVRNSYINDKDLWSFLSKKKEINYYQVVKMNNNRNTGFDDVVAGKIINIPIDKTDSTKLYHLISTCPIMYGPSEKFDIIKNLKSGTTVRFTGYTPDNVWARVMIDNGELGFVEFNCIQQGIGKEIPFGSKIIN